MDQLKKIFDAILLKRNNGKILICDKNKTITSIALNTLNQKKIIHIQNTKRFIELCIKKRIKQIFFVLHQNEEGLQKKIKLIAEQRLYFSEDFFVIRCIKNNNKIKDQCYKLLISLGFNFIHDCKTNSVFYFFYKYNICNYKTIPEWLNSDNWANPQLWEK